jgi:hypothetical protein
MIGRMALALAALLAAGVAQADVVPETAVVGTARVTLLPMEFLTEEELAALRMVLTNEQALLLFVPGQGGYAALAVNPDEGFIREGTVVGSAVALAELPDAATAATEAVKACEAARKAASPCVVVLTVEPAT